MIEEGFLTTEEVLEYLQVNLRTVYRLIKAGKIPAVRVGRQWRFRKRDIDAWLESQRPRSIARRRRDRPRATPPQPPDARACSSWTTRRAIRDLLSKTLALAEYDVDTGARRPHGARTPAHHSLRSADHRSQDAGNRRADRHS